MTEDERQIKLMNVRQKVTLEQMLTSDCVYCYDTGVVLNESVTNCKLKRNYAVCTCKAKFKVPE